MNHGWYWRCSGRVPLRAVLLPLSRDNKRTASRLVVVASLILLMRYTTFIWCRPSFHHRHEPPPAGRHASRLSYCLTWPPWPASAVSAWMFATQLMQRRRVPRSVLRESPLVQEV
jgi:hypothetical protein